MTAATSIAQQFSIFIVLLQRRNADSVESIEGIRFAASRNWLTGRIPFTPDVLTVLNIHTLLSRPALLPKKWIRAVLPGPGLKTRTTPARQHFPVVERAAFL
jgi:hypothetical protein